MRGGHNAAFGAGDGGPGLSIFKSHQGWRTPHVWGILFWKKMVGFGKSERTVGSKQNHNPGWQVCWQKGERKPNQLCTSEVRPGWSVLQLQLVPDPLRSVPTRGHRRPGSAAPCAPAARAPCETGGGCRAFVPTSPVPWGLSGLQAGSASAGLAQVPSSSPHLYTNTGSSTGSSQPELCGCRDRGCWILVAALLALQGQPEHEWEQTASG